MGDDDLAALRASVAMPERFEAVFDRHHDRIWRYLARLGGPACADDLASEVFLVAFARRAAYDPGLGAVSAWLYGIATNLARTRARRRARGDRAVARLVRRPASPVREIDETVVATDEVAAVRAALGRLSAPHREVLVLFAWEELSYDDIARVLDVEVGTVRSRLSRARARLRELLAASGQVHLDGIARRRTPHG